METIFIYDSIMKRKAIVYVGYFVKLSYLFTSSHEYDVLREYGIT